MYRTCFFVCFFFIISHLTLQGDSNLPLTNTDGGSPTIVNNCVSVISGDYIEASCDLYLKGPEPLVFERFYSSSDKDNEDLFYGWRHNHESSIHSTFPPQTNEISALYTNKQGKASTYYGLCVGTKTHVLKYQEPERKGFTNIGSRSISGRSHVKNNRVEYRGDGGLLVVKDGNGTQSYFGKSNLIGGDQGRVFYKLFKEQNSNGNIFAYEYKNGLLNFIKAMDSTTKVWYSWIKLNHLPKKELDRNLSFELESNDGRKVVYKLKKFEKDRFRKERYRIKEVIKPDAPYEKYEYIERSGSNGLQISKKRKPGNRFLGIEYYEEGRNSFNANKVSKLFSPVGFDDKPVMTHEFSYDGNKNRAGEIAKAVTYVFDAKRHLTKYWQTKDLRIDCIEKYQGTKNYQIYSKENFVWSDQGSLNCHYIQDQNNVIQAARVFKYDTHGNILKDSFYGNLQGGPTKITLDEHKYPRQEGCNSWTIEYRYSQDGRNLLLEEIEPNGKSTEYSYHADKDLVASKLILDHGQIKIREFYSYDNYALINCLIRDDGVTRDLNDLNGVTTRKITRTINQNEIPVGLPVQVDEYYLDPLNGSENLFKRVKNYYSTQGYLFHRETYDRHAALKYIEHFEYDKFGNVISEKNPLQKQTAKLYNKNNELVLERNVEAGSEKRYEYDFSGRVIAVKELYDNGSIFVTSNIYDHLNCLVATIDPFGQQTNYEFDEFGRLTKTIAPTYIDPMGNSHTYSVSKGYDIFGNVIESVDQAGHKTTTSYTSRGKPTLITYPGGSKEIFEFNDDGTLKRSIGKNGLITQYTHDCFGRLLKKELYSHEGFLSATSSTYNSFHKLTDTDAMGVTTYFSYTYSGLIESVLKNESLTEYEYDELQRPYQTKEWVNKTSYNLKTNTFDFLNRVTEEKVQDETGKILRLVQFVYDAAGNKIEVIEHSKAGLLVTKISFDFQGRPVKTIDAEGHVTRISYNANCFNKHGQRVLETKTEDALGIQTYVCMNIFGSPETIYKKNTLGELLSKKEIGYAATGNIAFTLETAMRPNQPIREILTKWTYNEQDCLKSLTEASGTLQQKVSHYYYNEVGEKIRTIKPEGQEIWFSYDALGHLRTFRGSDNSFSYLYEYDRNGNLTKSIDLVNNQTTFRVYDKDRMIKEVIGNGLEVSYAYDFIGRPINVTLPDRSTIAYEYNPLNLKKVTRHSKDKNELFSHAYVDYDLGGHLLEEESNIGKIHYQYNLNGQLIEIDSDLFSESMRYDACRNLISLEIKKTSQNTVSKFSYDDLYQLKSEKGLVNQEYIHDSLNNCVEKDGNSQDTNALNQLLKTFNQTFTYDGNGNRISDQTKNYKYDVLDRLTSVSTETEDIYYSYDSFNRRLSKSKKNKFGKLIESTSYLYFGQNEVGSCDKKGNLKEFRTLGTGKGAEIGATVGIEIGNELYFINHDHNGNIISLMDKTSKIVESYRYSAFGEEIVYDANNEKVEISTIGNPWRFSSKRVDKETGFLNFGRRYYDCKTATWMSPDPIGFEAGPNFYAYVMNNPLNNSDLYGLECVYCGGKCRYDSNRDYRCTNCGRINVRDGVSKSIQKSASYYAQKFKSSTIEFMNNLTSLQLIYYDDDFENGCKPSLNVDLARFNKTILPNAGIGYNNGIFNQLKNAISTVLNLSDLSGGYHIELSFNQTHGLKDIWECCKNHCFISTAPVRNLHETWNNYFKNAPKDGQWLQLCHSQGAIHVRNALMDYPPELRNRIHLVAIAPASFTPKGLCGSVKHYVSERDFVPLFDFFGRLACRDTTITLKPDKDAPWFDHSISSPTYKDVIQQNIRDFIINYGGVK